MSQDINCAHHHYDNQAFEQAFKIYEALAVKEDAVAMYNLARCYRLGHGTAKSIDKALPWYHKALAHKISEAAFELGYLYHTGEDVPEDRAQAVVWYEKAVAENHPMAACNLGWLYIHHDSPDKKQRALRLFKIAAKENIVQAHKHLADCYYQGYIVEKSPVKAFKHYDSAAALGCEISMHNLATMYFLAEGTDKDTKASVYWYEKAASKGNKSSLTALYQLGHDHNVHEATVAYAKLNLQSSTQE